jgi:hypothetical protein
MLGPGDAVKHHLMRKSLLERTQQQLLLPWSDLRLQRMPKTVDFGIEDGI